MSVEKTSDYFDVRDEAGRVHRVKIEVTITRIRPDTAPIKDVAFYLAPGGALRRLADGVFELISTGKRYTEA